MWILKKYCLVGIFLSSVSTSLSNKHGRICIWWVPLTFGVSCPKLPPWIRHCVSLTSALLRFGNLKCQVGWSRGKTETFANRSTQLFATCWRNLQISMRSADNNIPHKLLKQLPDLHFPKTWKTSPLTSRPEIHECVVATRGPTRATIVS